MFNFDKLLGRIIEKYGTRKAFAEAMGMRESSLSERLTGKIHFKMEEIYLASQLLDIRPEEIGEYFYRPKFDIIEQSATVIPSKQSPIEGV